MTHMFCRPCTCGPTRGVDAGRQKCIKPRSQGQPRLDWGQTEGWGGQFDTSSLSDPPTPGVNQQSDFWGPFYLCQQREAQVHNGEVAVLKLARQVNLVFPRPFVLSTLSVILLFFPPLGVSCIKESFQALCPHFFLLALINPCTMRLAGVCMCRGYIPD